MRLIPQIFPNCRNPGLEPGLEDGLKRIQDQQDFSKYFPVYHLLGKELIVRFVELILPN